MISVTDNELSFFLQVDFANQESQMAFYRSMQASGQDIRDFYDVISERRLVLYFPPCKSKQLIRC